MECKRCEAVFVTGISPCDESGAVGLLGSPGKGEN